MTTQPKTQHLCDTPSGQGQIRFPRFPCVRLGMGRKDFQLGMCQHALQPLQHRMHIYATYAFRISGNMSQSSLDHLAHGKPCRSWIHRRIHTIDTSMLPNSLQIPLRASSLNPAGCIVSDGVVVIACVETSSGISLEIIANA